MASVELRRLTKRFGTSTAVDNVNLKIDHGKLVCLLGPSGCGKTTTLRLIAGFVEPSDGEILVGDRMVSSPRRTLPPEVRNMSMIFQSYALWPHMTVAENIGYGLKIRGLDRSAIAAKLDTILAKTRLKPLAERYPGELSGGQQQRVSLARALIVEPETLLLDEPLSNLDANLREEMRFEVRRLHDEFHYTTVYVTHDQAEAMTTADLIAVMNMGRIEQLGAPEDIYFAPRSEFVARFIGGSNILRGKALDERHVSVANSSCVVRAQVCRPAAKRRYRCASTASEFCDKVPPNNMSNVLSATVTRQVFLGASRDYFVTLGDGTELRVTAPASQSAPAGAGVWLHLPPELCRALVE